MKSKRIQSKTSSLIHLPVYLTEGVGRSRRQQIPIEFYINDEENEINLTLLYSLAF